MTIDLSSPPCPKCGYDKESSYGEVWEPPVYRYIPSFYPDKEEEYLVLVCCQCQYQREIPTLDARKT